MTHTRRCRTCGWTGSYSSAAKADFAKRQHSCAWNLEKARRAESGRQIREAHARIDRTPKPCLHKQTTHEHGTHACYVLDRCKCLPCTKANREYETARSRRNAYGRSNYVSADASRAHVLSLMDQGMGLKRIVAVSEISQGLLWKLIYGKRRPDGSRVPSSRVRRDTEQRILAIELDLAGGAKVDSLGAVRRIQALVAAGWSMSKIAGRLGIGRANFTPVAHGRRDITVATDKAVRALYDEISMTLPPEMWHRDKIAASRARGYARRAGWLPPLAWDDDRIDDPDYSPEMPADLPRTWAQELDEIAIYRRIAGDRAVRLTTDEREAAIVRLHTQGLTDSAIAKRLGVSGDAVTRVRGSFDLDANDRESTAVIEADYFSGRSAKRRREQRQSA